MQTKKILAILLIIAGASISSCEIMLEPEPENLYFEERFFKEPAWAEGILLRCYASLPNFYSFIEKATDDAVTNVTTESYRRIATGEWSSQYNPISVWATAYNSIYYANYFLSVADKVEWSWESPLRDRLFRQKFTGEAYGIRAWYYFQLLQNHGGKNANGELQGFIILDKPTAKDSDWRLPRNSFEECVQFIYDDIDRGSEILPFDFVTTSDVDSTRCLGPQNKNRISGRILLALKSRVALHAASQAFNPTQEKWEYAANTAALLLQKIGGVAGISSTGNQFYLSPSDPDIIWRRDVYQSNAWERQNFPPSKFGNGETNPTQNLVDVFPMNNGYPITHASSGYNANNPYRNRDRRLADYIIYRGNRIGSNIINTNTEDATNGLNRTPTSTRTGYYLKKLLRETVNLAPNINSTDEHFYTLLRYTEIFLNYAEAANEAWGPDEDPMNYGFTPRTIIRAIRNRAGISAADPYLATITTTEDMRTLIRDERRIELCFEGFRFWDLRRWGLPLDETAMGMSITRNVYTEIEVEPRTYESFMKYGPIPYQDLLKNNNLIQNEGW